MANGNGKSPYNCYNKRPHRYSSLYQDWKAARDSGRTREAAELGRQHTERWLGNNIRASIRELIEEVEAA